tara:strand:+ start:855 stop:1037 length:183 start_codon:yes stop_codon:yes gene_type:complete
MSKILKMAIPAIFMLGCPATEEEPTDVDTDVEVIDTEVPEDTDVEVVDTDPDTDVADTDT